MNDVAVSLIFKQVREKFLKTCIAMNGKVLVNGDSKMTEQISGHEQCGMQMDNRDNHDSDGLEWEKKNET